MNIVVTDIHFIQVKRRNLTFIHCPTHQYQGQVGKSKIGRRTKMKMRKLNLSVLEIQSFVTSLGQNHEGQVYGGTNTLPSCATCVTECADCPPAK